MSHSVETYMPLVIEKYLGDTMHLTRDQHGGYMLLLFAYWRGGGPLPDDDGFLAATVKATPAEWKKLRPVLVRFFQVHDGHWHQKRADAELARARSKSEAAAEAARIRWERSAGGDADASSTHKRPNKPKRSDGNAPLSKNSPDADASGSKPARKACLPTDWQPTEAHRQRCAELGLDCDLEAERMRAWAESKGERRPGWDATFTGWILREGKANGGRTGQQGRTNAGSGDTARDAEIRRRRAENDAAMVASSSDGSVEAALRRADDGEGGYNFGRA